MRTVLRGGRVVDPGSGVDADLDVVIEGEHLAAQELDVERRLERLRFVREMGRDMEHLAGETLAAE